MLLKLAYPKGNWSLEEVHDLTTSLVIVGTQTHILYFLKLKPLLATKLYITWNCVTVPYKMSKSTLLDFLK